MIIVRFTYEHIVPNTLTFHGRYGLTANNLLCIASARMGIVHPSAVTKKQNLKLENNKIVWGLYYSYMKWSCKWKTSGKMHFAEANLALNSILAVRFCCCCCCFKSEFNRVNDGYYMWHDGWMNAHTKLTNAEIHLSSFNIIWILMMLFYIYHNLNDTKETNGWRTIFCRQSKDFLLNTMALSSYFAISRIIVAFHSDCDEQFRVKYERMINIFYAIFYNWEDKYVFHLYECYALHIEQLLFIYSLVNKTVMVMHCWPTCTELICTWSSFSWTDNINVSVLFIFHDAAFVIASNNANDILNEGIAIFNTAILSEK